MNRSPFARTSATALLAGLIGALSALPGSLLHAASLIPLGDLPGGSFTSRALSVSGDGSVVVGSSNGASGNEAFWWTSGGGMVGLGDLAGGSFSSSALGVSDNGSVVVGHSSGSSGTEAFVWTEGAGIQRLENVLNDFGVDLTGWTVLFEASSLSTEGRFIAGYGTHLGNQEAYLADLSQLDLAWTNSGNGDWEDRMNWTNSVFSPGDEGKDNVSILPTNSATVAGASRDTTVTSLVIGAQTSGVAELAFQANLATTGEITVQDKGRIRLAGQTLTPGSTLTIDGDGQVTGYGLIVGTIGGTSGSAGVVGSGSYFHSTEPINFPQDYGSTPVTVVSRGLADLGPHTTLGDGTVNATVTAPNGVYISGSSILEGPGVVNGKIAAAVGSTIDAGSATGDLTVGDAASPAGFHSDGELYTGGNMVEIYDRNEAVLGSLTTLGDGASGGTLAAGTAMVGDTHPHFLVEQGKNVTGRGTIEGNFKNNGHVIGDGTATGERIVFGSDWTVSGIGTFENTLVMGTFAPGLSPAVVAGENFAFGGIVEIELGGTTPGSGSNSHDQIVDLGSTQLIPGVDLVLKPWNGFEPEIGDEFEILTWSDNLVGQFTTVLVDPYFAARGINFELDYGDNSLTAVAVTALPGDFDLDGDVDGRDFLAWQRNPSIGNLANWQANYGLGSVSTATNFAVPEPSSLLLGLFTVLSFSFRGHKRAAQRLPRRSSEAGSGAWQFRIDANQPMAI